MKILGAHVWRSLRIPLGFGTSLLGFLLLPLSFNAFTISLSFVSVVQKTLPLLLHCLEGVVVNPPRVLGRSRGFSAPILCLGPFTFDLAKRRGEKNSSYTNGALFFGGRSCGPGGVRGKNQQKKETL